MGLDAYVACRAAYLGARNVTVAEWYLRRIGPASALSGRSSHSVEDPARRTPAKSCWNVMARPRPPPPGASSGRSGARNAGGESATSRSGRAPPFCRYRRARTRRPGGIAPDHGLPGPGRSPGVVRKGFCPPPSRTLVPRPDAAPPRHDRAQERPSSRVHGELGGRPRECLGRAGNAGYSRHRGTGTNRRGRWSTSFVTHAVRPDEAHTPNWRPDGPRPRPPPPYDLVRIVGR